MRFSQFLNTSSVAKMAKNGPCNVQIQIQIRAGNLLTFIEDFQ